MPDPADESATGIHREVFEFWDHAPDELVGANFEELRIESAYIVGERGDEQLVVEYEVI